VTTLTRNDLLILLIEECSEVIQAATKCQRFGFESDHGTGYGRNDEVLAQEIGDLLGIVDALPLNTAIIGALREQKIAKAEVAKTLYGVKS
jgi:NTP pyrophosphatase (non-canonical NTP hydrolase)